MEKNLNVYEIGYLLVPTIAEEEVGAKVQELKSLLEKSEVSFITEDFPKLRPLAYQMIKVIASQNRKFDKAYFGWIKFEVDRAAIPALKKELEKSDDLLRFMLIETVRENTLASQRIAYRPTSATPEAVKIEEDADKPKLTAEELDKSIDNLVVE